MKKILKQIIIKILSLQAKMIIGKFNPYIIGVVGAVGKTSTKDSVAAIFKITNKEGENLDKEEILEYNGEVSINKNIKSDFIATKKSMNSEFGVPLTIIGADSGWDSPLAWFKIILKGLKVYFQKDYVKYLILEVGADQKGDIKEIATWLRCDIVIATMYGDVPVHVENFKNREELIAEDEYLIKSLKDKGMLIYNLDCKDACDIADRFDKENTKAVLSYGKNGDIKIKNILNDAKRQQVSAQLSLKNKLYTLECFGVLGDAAIYSAMPAILVADILNFDLKTSLSNIKEMDRSAGRMKILAGKNYSTIIDDTYNSSPVAVMNGLKVIKNLTVSGRKIIVLGDMMELGKYATDEHFKIGELAAKSGDILLTVGTRSKHTASGAKSAGMGEGWILECKNAKEAGEEVINILKEGDIVYVKGSQSMRMERAVKLLAGDNVDIKKELVRQEKEWVNR
jgi:UDP-N-acetylmuramoyl-tripeptide--D-alanyl-D-alanine ligase